MEKVWLKIARLRKTGIDKNQARFRSLVCQHHFWKPVHAHLHAQASFENEPFADKLTKEIDHLRESQIAERARREKLKNWNEIFDTKTGKNVIVPFLF